MSIKLSIVKTLAIVTNNRWLKRRYVLMMNKAITKEIQRFRNR